MQSLEHKIPPPIVFLVTCGVIWLTSAQAGQMSVEPLVRYSVIAVLLILSAVTGPLAIRAFIRVRTTINPIDIRSASRLVVEGPFRFTRNPMYLSMALLLSALAAYFASAWSLIWVGLFIAFITRFQIIPEERAMSEKFGAPYAAYRARVRRWI
jgi:protein-S-isoprenylcysteine O-methyltransferase Ste14